MSSAAELTTDVTADPATAKQKVDQVLSAEKATIAGTAPDGSVTDFTTRKTMFSWELQGRITLAPTAGGTSIHLVLDTHNNRPTALADGMKNARSAKKLMEKITAAF
ncbi:MAG: hypothetical protein ACTIAA_10360 [Microbacterium sp.]